MRLLRSALAAVAPLVIAVQLPAQARRALPPTAEVARVADSLVGAFMAKNSSPGIAVAIVRGTDTVVMRGWGQANLELDVPADARTVFRIGSVTKQFTSAAVLQLVDSGKVKLDEPIGGYLPTLPAAWHPVTVRQLLNHTSGIRSYTSVGPKWVARWGEEMSPDTIVALVANDTFDFAPGTKWSYNNTGYVILGMLVSKVAGRPWGRDLEARFLKPLGLTDTRNCLTLPLVPRRASGYSMTGAGWTNARYLAMTQPYSAGAMCSTLADLTRWNRALHAGMLLSSASYAAMITPTGAAEASHYGFGLGRDTIGAYTRIAHGGGINGFLCENLWIPEVELSLTVLTNGDGEAPGQLTAQLTRTALGLPLVQPLKPVAIASAALARYVGTYALALPGGPRDFTISLTSPTLSAQLAGQGPIPLIHYGDHTFGADFDPGMRVVFTVTGDKATKLTLKQGGGTMEAPRKEVPS